MKNETSNIFFRCRNLLFLIRIMAFLEKKARRKIAHHFKNQKDYYPQSIRTAVNQEQRFAKNHENFLLAKDDFVDDFEKKIKLASGYLIYKGAPNWKMTWEDDEQTESLHRWHWLIFELTTNPETISFAWGIGMMRSWLSEMGALPTGLAGTSYSVSERIANACLFAVLCQKQNKETTELPNDIKFALLQMTDYLVAHLEYHDAETTCNHIINNARALLFVGQELNLPEASKLACQILKNDLGRLITADGFLNNGSSHYHFLFTRWLLEIAALLEQSRYYDCFQFVKPLAEKLLNQCRFFMIPNQSGRMTIPLFGDISPDCSPDWLLNRPNFIQAKNKSNVNFQSFADSYWYRLDKNDFIVIWHTEPALDGKNGVHSHNDICSCVVYFKGEPLLLDLGRRDYLEIESIEASAHNSLTVDNMEPVLTRQYSQYPFFYRKTNVEISWQECKNKFFFTIKHDGFKRISGDKIRHTRKFIIADDTFKVLDLVDGRGIHTIKTFFQIGANENIELKRKSIHTENRNMIDTWLCPAYGKKLKAKTVIFTDHAKLPLATTYIIKPIR